MAPPARSRGTFAVVATDAPAPVATRARRRPLGRHPWRVVITVGTVLLAVNLLVYAELQSDTSPAASFPAEVVSVEPAPGTLGTPDQVVGVTLRADLTGALVIDDHEIPADQITRTTANNVSFQPGPGKDITSFTPGPHSATVLYWPQTGTRASSSSYTFTFRTTA